MNTQTKTKKGNWLNLWEPQFRILISPTFPPPSLFKYPCCVPVIECLSPVMSLSASEERARIHRIASNDRLVKQKARVQRNKDEFTARLRAEERETKVQKISKDKRDSCLCLSCFLVLVLLLTVSFGNIFAQDKSRLRQGKAMSKAADTKTWRGARQQTTSKTIIPPFKKPRQAKPHVVPSLRE